MNFKFPKGLFFTIKETAKLNQISHRRAERILNDLVYMKKLESKQPKYNSKDKRWFFLSKSEKSSTTPTKETLEDVSYKVENTN